MRLVLATTTLLVSVAGPAAAEPLAIRAAPAAATFDVGVRVGGYGFHREGDNRPGEGWTECRMNGLGVFGSRVLRGPLFLEAGLDAYASADGPLAPEPTDLPVDRMSGLISVALGARTQVTSWLRGYVQVGAGVELTRVSVPYGDTRIRDNQALPEGFVGAGLDLRIARGTYVGASLRMLVMGNFDYDRARLDMDQGWVAAPAAADVFAPSPDLAAQGQFYVRREL